VPYWSIDLFYALSFFLCRSRAELDIHGRRLLSAQLVAVACFLAFPLRFAFERPPTASTFGLLFELLGSFDRPFNQAPSLHIALLVVLWPLYARHAPRPLRPVVHGWGALVGVSVLTTWQHHFVDLPTGAWLGFFCLWLWPDGAASPLTRLARVRDARRWRLAAIYGGGALACAVLAGRGGGALWLLWPAAAFALVAVAYAGLGTAVFQKDASGETSLAARVLLAPYHLGAWISSRLWTWRQPAPSPLCDGVAIGRVPSPRSLAAGGFAAVVDLAPELPARVRGVDWRTIPMLDLVAPEPAALREAAAAIEEALRRGPVLVCCALGLSRSTAAAATWLVLSGRASSATEALATVAQARPRLVLGLEQRRQVVLAASPGGP
jgi:membrane-associated phospholipid phosphatase